MRFGFYLAILFGATLLSAAGVWLLPRSRKALWLIAAGLGCMLLASAVKARDLVSEFRGHIAAIQDDLSHLRAASTHSTTNLYELRAEEFTRELLAQDKYKDPRNLNRFEAKIYSQAGEDGIIAEIFRRVGTTSKDFVEFGSGDGRENNTVSLLTTQGWKGLWIEGDNEAVGRARQAFADYVGAGTLRVDPAFITAENIETLFRNAKVAPEFDLLSVDIDRNDYYVWQNIRQFRPRVVVVEYNAIFPPDVEWVVPYDANAWWDLTSRHGASLGALEQLGREKGYALVGCSLSGVNAFFVRADLVGNKFLSPSTAAVHYEPPRYFLISRALGHPRRP